MNNNISRHIYSDDVKEKAVSTKNLTQRLIFNKKYQSKDFSDWLFRRLNIHSGEVILDVGCGTGAQTSRFLDNVGSNGRVDALDISESSINHLKELHRNESRLNAITADMAALESVTKVNFKESLYSLVHASYSLYYCPTRVDVLHVMARKILPTGRVAIFTPVEPHGMVEMARRFSAIPQEIDDCFAFGKDILEPEFRKLFWEVEIHYFQSEILVQSVNDFVEFYRATTYYDAAAEAPLRLYAEKKLKDEGAIKYSKNGYLIIGSDVK